MSLLAIDLGTTGVRAVIVTSDGRQIGSGEVEIGLHAPAPGWAEQPAEAFWQGTVQAVRSALAQAAIDPASIAGIGFSHQRGTFALVGETGAPLHDFVVWMDHRGVPYLDEIRARMEPLSYYDITGVPIYFVSSLSKLVWFARERPALVDAAWRMWPIASVIMARMGVDDPPLDHATATFYGLLDSRSRQWSPEILDRLGLRADLLPRLAAPGTVAGTLSNPAAAAELGLRLGTPLVLGGGDQQCAALGSGMIEPGQGLINLGTATAVMAAVDGPARDTSEIIPSACHALPDQYEMEGHTQASGIVFQRFRDEFAQPEVEIARQGERSPYDLLVEQASASAPGAGGLVFLPTFNGTTAPINFPQGSGALLGLHITHTRADVIRAMLEGMCYESRWILEHMEAGGTPVRTVYLSGGGSKSPFWCQLHADILQRPVTRSSTSNAAAVGAAICAGLGTGIFAGAAEGVRSLSRLAETYTPGSDASQAYRRSFELFKTSYETIYQSGLFLKLHDFFSWLQGQG